MLKSSQIFNISPESKTGFVYGTEFEFSVNLDVSKYTQLAWSMGDGTFFYNTSSIKHTYQYPGIYNVSLSASSRRGEFITDYGQINADYLYRDALLISKVPAEFGLPSTKSANPFVVQLTSAKIDEPIQIVLQTLNTNSIPHYAVPTKWDFLIPRWRFLDSNTLETLEDSVTVNTTPLYYDGKVVAVSGEVSFYYIDDLATGIDPVNDCPLLITTTLSTQNFSYPKESLIYPYYSYSNSEVTRAVIAWQINDTIPTHLKVSENYLNNIYQTKWKDVPIPVMVTCEFDSKKIPNYEFYTTEAVSKVLSYPKSNALGKQHPLILTLSSSKTGFIEPSAYKLEHSIQANYTINSNVVSVTSINHDFEDEDFCFCRTIEGILPSSWYSSITAKTDRVFEFLTKTNVEDSTGVLYFEKPLYFQANDERNNITTGYVFTSITPLISFDSTTVVCASTIATNTVLTNDSTTFSYPNGFPIYPYVYISHPNQQTINRLSVVTYPSKCTSIQYYKDLNLLLDGTLSLVQTPGVTADNIVNYELSGRYSGIYGLAFNPIANILYATDADQNTLISFNQGTTLSNVVELSSFTNSNYNTPSYISIDGNSNVWITLYNNYLALKFDRYLNLLLSAAPTTNIDLSSYSKFADPLSISEPTDGDPLIAPPIVETDRDNNVWVCYANEDYSQLVKFDGNTGEELVSLTTNEGLRASPTGLAIDKLNNVWVISYDSSSLQKVSSEGVLLSTFDSSFLKPSYIALDRDQNVWITHGYDLCGVLNTQTLGTSSWKFTKKLRKSVYQESYTSNDSNAMLSSNEIWGGLASDVFGRLWVINSESNTVGTFSPKEPNRTRVVGVVPYVDRTYILKNVVLSGEDYVAEVPAEQSRSAQAIGDWTGNKWYQKYSDTLASLPVSGISSEFTIYPLNNSFQVAKINEDFNCSEYLRSLALPEYMEDFQTFFGNFLESSVGTGKLSAEEIGRVVYEKIANFVMNNADYQTAEITQLKSLANEIGVDFKTYGIDFPVEINRLIQLFSIPKHRLRGRVKYDTDLENIIGNQLTTTSSVTADNYIFMRDRLFKKMQLVYVPPIKDLNSGLTYTVYPLSALTVNGARQPLLSNYFFFEKKENILGYTNNIIDWNNPETTINFTLSTAVEWYDNDKMVDTLFNNILTKRLFG